MPALKPDDPKHARAAERLREDLIGWITTITPDGQPQSTPIWFLWNPEAETFLVYSLRDGQRIRNVEAHPRVALHLEGDGAGGDNVIFEALAEHVSDHPPAHEVPAYVDKYRGLIEGYGWTPESFSQDYPHPLRITATRARIW